MFDKEEDGFVYIIVIYGRNVIEERKRLWDFIYDISNRIDVFWCLCGDYNIVLNMDDRFYMVVDLEIRYLKVFMDIFCLFEMKVSGRYFIWINGYIFSKIDNVLCNDMWFLKYGYVIVNFRENFIFDYIFIYLEFFDMVRGRKGLFRFLSIIVKYVDFLEIIEDVWKTYIMGIDMFRLWRKLYF